MARKLRYVPPEGGLFEITTRTVQGRFLLKPSAELNTIILGILGRAQRLYPVEIHAFAFLANHYHLLTSVDTAHQRAAFMGYFNGNLGKEVACHIDGWSDKVWSRRYQAIYVSPEDSKQVDRLRYILAQGAKDGLVASPRDWPGVTSLPALVDGESLDGLWFDRSREYVARRAGKAFHSHDFATTETVTLTQMPCWAHLESSAYTSRLMEMVVDIEQETAQRHADAGTEPLGQKAILRQRSLDRPKRLKKSPAPFAHCATKRVRRMFGEAYSLFYAAYREAADKLKAGDLTAVFPEGSFPPPLPFKVILDSS
ncbi:MAG: transposase [Thermoanaerobaculia bacterium]